MENLLILNAYGEPNLAWRPSHNKDHHHFKKQNLRKTLITKSPNLRTSHSLSSVQPFQPLPKLQPNYDYSHAIPGKKYSRQTEIRKENFNENLKLRLLLEKLNRIGSNPVQILEHDGDWNNELFWIVIKFLKHASRTDEIPQVFNLWAKLDETRVNESNYKNIIGSLSEEGLMEEAISKLEELKTHGLTPSVEIYNSIIHGYAWKSRFDDALTFLNEMKQANIEPNSKTYNGIIEAYGHYEKYDEIGKCVKKMEFDGFILDSTTYNLLIREFSRGGFLKKMEKIYLTISSKKMEVQPSTLIAMLEAYANFKLIEKMEKVYKRILNSRTAINDNLIRKLAYVYIESFMFSRLDDLAIGLSSKTGLTDLVWCLRLLSHACLFSKQGMDSIVAKMEENKVTWNINFVNIISLAYMKMENFIFLQKTFLELPIRQVGPDIVTFGILFDAIGNGFDGSETRKIWRRMGYFSKFVEMNTDPLVLTAFEKGKFLQSFEDKYSSLDIKDREKKTWSYESIIDLVYEGDNLKL